MSHSRHKRPGAAAPSRNRQEADVLATTLPARPPAQTSACNSVPELIAPVTPADAPVPIGVGIDTSRYGHYASFLRADLQPAAADLKFVEAAAG